jgi:hypothetical protein
MPRSYPLAIGESRLLSLALSAKRLARIRHRTVFFVLTAVKAGSVVAKRGFYFTPGRGGVAKR